MGEKERLYNIDIMLYLQQILAQTWKWITHLKWEGNKKDSVLLKQINKTHSVCRSSSEFFC